MILLSNVSVSCIRVHKEQSPSLIRMSKDLHVPGSREESDARVIINAADVKLRSFNTKVSESAHPLCSDPGAVCTPACLHTESASCRCLPPGPVDAFWHGGTVCLPDALSCCLQVHTVDTLVSYRAEAEV